MLSSEYFITTFVTLLLSPTSLAREWGIPGRGYQGTRTTGLGVVNDTYTISYTTIVGFFQQDDPATDPETFDYTANSYGLINQPYPTDADFDPVGERTQWERFENYVDALNRDARENDGEGKTTQYKVLFMARHGEGYHNAAESYYGTPAWNCYWGPLDGNGTTIWRDAALTSAGLSQCTKASNFWASALVRDKIPAPQSYYSSPLIRAATTANLTFGSLSLPADRPFRPVIKEFLREGISIRSCDSRSDRGAIAALLPNFEFEPGFAETDELWRGDAGETTEAQDARTKSVLDDIFAGDRNTWVSVTSHSGEIRETLKVLGHRSFSLATGQAIPVLVEAVELRKPTPTTTVGLSFTSEATCANGPPVTSVAGQGCVCSAGATGPAMATAIVTAIPI